MALRARYFPAVVFLGCILLLIVPFYYMDHWISFSSTRPNSLSTSTVRSAFKMTANRASSVDINNPDSQLNEISRQGDEDEEDEAEEDELVADKNKRLNISTINRYKVGFGHPEGGGGGVALGPSNRLPFTFQQQLNPRAGEFALQMARDRLRIERYGMMMQSNDGSTDVEWENWLKESSTDNNTAKLQILIVSYFRGGTTFFGDLLNQHPGTFYHFEPLHGVSGNDQVQLEGDIFKSVSLLRHLLRCEYEGANEYIEWIRQDLSHRFLFEHNRRLWLSCQFQLPLCFDYKFLRSMCELHPIHLFKVVRLRLSHARRLLDEFPRLKLIYMVRDPRGLYSSRRDLEWCSTTQSCIDPDVYCPDMLKDLSTAISLKSKYPQRFLAVRYEDVALDTENQMKKAFQFLDLNYNRTYKQLGRFIESHTKTRYKSPLDDGGPYSIRRDSRKTAFSWRKKLSPHEVSYVESACKDVIRQLALP